MSPKARAYLSQVFDYIEQHALMCDRADMPAESHRVYSVTAWSAYRGLSYGGDPWSCQVR